MLLTQFKSCTHKVASQGQEQPSGQKIQVLGLALLRATPCSSDSFSLNVWWRRTSKDLQWAPRPHLKGPTCPCSTWDTAWTECLCPPKLMLRPYPPRRWRVSGGRPVGGEQVMRVGGLTALVLRRPRELPCPSTRGGHGEKPVAWKAALSRPWP